MLRWYSREIGELIREELGPPEGIYTHTHHKHTLTQLHTHSLDSLRRPNTAQQAIMSWPISLLDNLYCVLQFYSCRVGLGKVKRVCNISGALWCTTFFSV